MKRSYRLIIGVVLICFLFSSMLIGCGKSAETAKNPESSAAPAVSTQEQTQTPAETVKEPITLKFTFWGSPQEKAAIENAVSKFEEKYNWIDVNAIHIPADYDTKLTTMVAGNEEPDVAYLESATIAYPLAEQGKLLNMEEYVNTDPEINKSTLIPNIYYYWETGKLAGIFSAPECAVLFYNTEIFSKAGIAPPPTKVANAWTWDQFVDTAKKLTIDQNGKNATESGFDPKKIQQFGVNIPLWWAMWGPFVYSNGGDFLSEDGSKLGLTQPESVEALQNIADLINVHHVMPSPVQAKSLPNTTQSLQTEKVAMVIDGQWVNLDLSAATDLKYDIGVLPVMKKPATIAVGAMTSIFSSSKHPKEAWELVKFLVNPEYSIDLLKGGLWMPVLSDWYKDSALLSKWAENNPAHPAGFKDSVLDSILNYGVVTPTATVKNFNQIMNIINPALDKVWLGQQSVADALKEVEQAAQAEVKGRRPVE